MKIRWSILIKGSEQRNEKQAKQYFVQGMMSGAVK